MPWLTKVGGISLYIYKPDTCIEILRFVLMQAPRCPCLAKGLLLHQLMEKLLMGCHFIEGKKDIVCVCSIQHDVE